MTHLQCDDQLIKDICNGYLQDTSCIGATLPAGVTLDPNNGLYWITDKISVPNISILRERLINEFHNSAGHLDYERAYSVIFRTFYWPDLRKDVKFIIKTCPKCQRIEPRTEKPYGSSMPLPVSTRPWESVSIDFITNLYPNVDGHDAILIVVCTLSKMAHFIPCNSTVNSRQLVKLFLDNVYRPH
jgi:hypothetical protein